MADATIQTRDKKSEKMPDKKAESIEDDYLRLEDEDSLLFDKPKESKTRSKTSKASSKSAAQGKPPSLSTPSTSKAKSSSVSGDANNNNEMLDILKQIRSEQVKTNCRVDNMNKRIDALYDEEYQYDDENQNESDCYDDACGEVQADNEKRDEPPSKKQKSDSCEETRFASMSKKFRSGEKYAPSINEQLLF
ncbi:unnamed protein product [Mytilus edulis]|uniref:Uncharacterized protein n=1 Tax=Mytilus edulis TaxID=6550 RepID=A0A8S3RU16_MYTED|nr:unnamed protein product [Mytilus edulis]